MQEISKSTGLRIRKAREEKDITQKELGDVLGYSPMGVSHFEKGIRELKLSDIKKIASYFGKDLSYFLSTGPTLYRAGDTPNENGVKESLEAFDKFLVERKSK